MAVRSPLRALPYYASPFVGREVESALLQDLIDDPLTCLVTITGPAGIGKTRLAASMASGQAERSTLFVPLAAIHDPDLVPTEIGKALDVQGDNLLERIREHLETWQGILLLDNIEQVIVAASAISEIIPPTPHLTVLITSQRPLQIEGEHVVRLDPLPIPDREASGDHLLGIPSVQLLINRATEQDASFRESLHDESTTEALAEICRKLDGIPLALELAASRLNSLSPEVVLTQLERDQTILSSSRQDTPARQRTMHTAISWSYFLLPSETQRIFLWLGSFTSGFDLAIVERLIGHLEISSRAVDVVSDLIDLSLIRRISGGANPWYSMLVPIRHFCLAELGTTRERDDAEAFVAEYVAELANRSKDELQGPNFGDWLGRLDREQATIRSAVSWALAHQNPLVPMLVASRMQYFFEQEGAWREMVGWIDAAWEWRNGLPEYELLNGMLAKLSIQEEARDLEGANATDAVVQKLLETNDHPVLEMRYLVLTGNVAIDQQQWEIAEAKFIRTLEIAEREDIPRAAHAALGNLATIAHFRGDYDTALKYLEEVEASFKESGDLATFARVLSNKAAIHNAQGNYQQSLEYLREAAEIEDDLSLRQRRLFTLLNVATAHEGLRDLDAADAASHEVIIEARVLGYKNAEVMGEIRLANTGLLRENISVAYQHISCALTLQTVLHGASEYIQLGVLAARALALESRYHESATVLGKSLAWGEAIGHTFELDDKQLLTDLQRTLKAEAPHYRDAVEEGAFWSDEVFIRNITRYTRPRMAPAGRILVRIPEAPASVFSTLTSREREILQHLIDGFSTRGMADSLNVSPRTITTHIGNIMAKVDVNSRMELVAKALRNQKSAGDDSTYVD